MLKRAKFGLQWTTWIGFKSGLVCSVAQLEYDGSIGKGEFHHYLGKRRLPCEDGQAGPQGYCANP